MTTYEVFSSAQLTDHVMELGYQLAMIQHGRGDTDAALAEIDVLAGKLTVLRERLTGRAAPVDGQRTLDGEPLTDTQARRAAELGLPLDGERHITPQTLPAGLVALVERTWRDGSERLPDDMPYVEYWAARARAHDQMVTAYGQLLKAVSGVGLLTYHVIDAADYHRERAARARRNQRDAELDTAVSPMGETPTEVVGTMVPTGLPAPEIDAARVVSGMPDTLPAPESESQARELAELLAVLWHLCDEGQLPAELDSLLLGEYFHLRPARPDMLGAVRALADEVDW